MAIPVLIAAALLTAVTLVLIFAEVSKSARTALLAIDLVLWAFFALDFLVRFVLTPYKRRFARTEWLDLLLVVVPIFQPLRLVGAFLRLARLSAALDRTTRGAKLLMGRHKLYLALTWAAGLVLIASVVTPIVEPDSSKIKGFGDGAWWALVTTTTVGYGDLVPESGVGKMIGATLMIVGVGIIGLITANIASLFLEPAPVEAPPDAQDVEERTVDERLDHIEQKLDAVLRSLTDNDGATNQEADRRTRG